MHSVDDLKRLSVRRLDLYLRCGCSIFAYTDSCNPRAYSLGHLLRLELAGLVLVGEEFQSLKVPRIRCANHS